MVEALDSGITTVVDWSHNLNGPDHADAALDALRQGGGRATFAYGATNDQALCKDESPHTRDVARLLVCNWAMVERHKNCFNFPNERSRWIMHDESFSIGDRTLHAVRPPVYDSPTTRGLFDPTTGVYWAVDSFATPLPDPQMPVADLDPDFWQFAMTLFAFGAVSPWLALVDHDKFGRSVDTVQSLDITTIAACHTPVIEGPFIQRAFDRIREFPSVEAPPLPDQSILDQVIAATALPNA